MKAEFLSERALPNDVITLVLAGGTGAYLV